MDEFEGLADDPRDLLRTQPRVSPSAFLRLSDDEEDRFLELSACLGAAGMVGDQTVTVLSNATNGEVHVETVTNNKDWASL